MTLRRALDASFLNAVANHEVVRRSFPWSSDIDLSDVLTTPGAVAFLADGGFFLFKPSAHGVYEVDTMFLPGSSARVIREASRLAAGIMFDAYGADRLDLLTLRSNVPARQLAKWVGFRTVNTQVRTVRGCVCDLVYMTLDAQSFRKVH